MATKIQHRAFSIKLKHDPTFWACYPHPRFPALSITGGECVLNCKHCGGHYLKHMLSCSSPSVLFRTCLNLAANGARGVLLSGGYNEEGYVPFEPFLDAIERVKRETGVFLNIHTGLVPGWLARELGRAGVDMASVDVIGSDETIKLVLGLKRTTRDYKQALRDLSLAIPHVVPHICIGLHAGELKGEREAIEIAARAKISALVFLIIIPTAGTSFQNVSPPEPATVGELIAEARLRAPDRTLALGCMRPRDARRVELELQALRSGIDRVEIPSERTLEAARSMGLSVERLDACCAVPSEIVEGWISN